MTCEVWVPDGTPVHLDADGWYRGGMSQCGEKAVAIKIWGKTPLADSGRTLVCNYHALYAGLLEPLQNS